jgi:hypothetical protein
MSRRGGGTTLYILWALTAYPLQLYVKGEQHSLANSEDDRNAHCSLAGRLIRSLIPSLWAFLTALVLSKGLGYLLEHLFNRNSFVI